jgi:hypothetical protein
MRTFVDNVNRSWSIQLTIDSAKRVKGLLDVNLLDLIGGDPPLLTRLGTDIVLLCDVIFVLIKPQADTCSVTDEQFGAALGGEAILAAQSAFYDELISFFQGMGRKDLLKAVVAQRNLIDKAVQNIATQIEAIDLDKVVEETVGKLSMSSPEV